MNIFRPTFDNFLVKASYLKTSYNSAASLSYNPHVASDRERNKAVSAYYNQPAIDAAARKPSVRLTPALILYSGHSDEERTVKSAQYLQRELPIRIAKRVVAFRALPFIVGCNPIILSVHELFIRAFNILNSFDLIRTSEDEVAYSQKLQELLNDHKDVVSMLAEGFRDCQRHMQDYDIITKFLDTTLTSRLGIRMLAEHHLALMKNHRDNYIGIINKAICLKDVIERNCQLVSGIAQHKYGKSVEIKLSGHINATFPYIQMPLDYILPEILKNAFRATIEAHKGVDAVDIPPIRITVASNEVDFIIRISDRGGGIPHHLMNKVLQYNFSTAPNKTLDTDLDDDDIFSGMMEAVNPGPSAGPMHGFGFGLPTSRAYATYMGGSLDIQTMQGIGTDVYLRLKHINSKSESFRI